MDYWILREASVIVGIPPRMVNGYCPIIVFPQ